MRVLRLDLLAFGPFTNVSLDLSAGNEGLHVVYGPNEAGKTSTLRALCQLLYGIPERTTDDFLHPKPKLRLGARIRDREGRELAFIRHKARKITVTADDGLTPLEPGLLDRFLAGVNEGGFNQQFGINRAALAQGSDQIRQGSNAGQLLFDAALGSSAGIRSVQQALQDEMDALFRPTGRNQKINKAITELRGAQHALKDRLVSSEEYVRHERALKEAEESRSRLEAERQETRRRLGQVLRTRDALKAIPRRKQLVEQLADCADAVLLPDDFGERWRTTVQALRLAEQRAEQARQEIERLDRRLGQVEVPEAILSQADAIERLQELLGKHRAAMSDRPRLVGFRQHSEHAAREILRSLGRPADLAAAEQRRVSADEELRIQNLGNEHLALTERVELATEKIKRLARRIEEAEEQLAELEEPRVTAELRAALRLVQQEGPLEKQCDEARANLRRIEQQARKDQASLPLWNGSLEALEVLAVPAAETIDRCEQEQQAARNRIAQLGEQRREADTAARELAGQIDQLQAAGEVPSEEDLAAARGQREAGWRLVRRAWKEGGTDPAEEARFVAGVAGAGGLAEAYERSVERTDHLADRLRREVDRVTLLARLRSELQKKTAHRARLDGQVADAEAHHARLHREWLALWQPLGVDPLPPKEMRTWLRRQNELAGQVRALGEQREQVDALQARIDRHGALLQAALHQAGDTAGSEPTLALLLARAQQTIEQADQVEKRRGELERDRDGFRRELRDAEAERSQAVDRLSQWEMRWREAMGRLGLGAEATPAEANVLLAEMDKLQTRLGEVRGNSQRIEGIDRDAERFTVQVRELASRVAADLSTAPVERVCEDLKERLKQARAAAKDRDDLRQQRERESHRLADAEACLQASRVQLELLCREAGCEGEQELAAAERRSGLRRQLESELRALDEQLQGLSGTQPLAEFLAVVGQADPGLLDDEVARLEEDIGGLEKQIARLDQAIGGERKELERMETSGGAADHALDVENRVAELQQHVVHYAALRLASCVLQESVERYRKKNQNAVLARAGELFARLTAGSFEGVRVEVDDPERPLLLAVRAGGKEALPVEGLSDGTHDQLYLALRLASLEDHVRNHEPFPFIVDDVLLNFDDERAVAALQALGELSRHTQIIFFTHHQHLVDLARESLPEGTLFVHRLAREVLGA